MGIDPTSPAPPAHERVDVRDLRSIMLDMDGVLYRGETAIAGARELLEFLRLRGIPSLFLTNNSSLTPEDYVAKLARMGIRTTPDRVLTSALVAVEDLRHKATPRDRFFLLGGAGIRAAMAVAGLTLADRYTDATYVLAGLDRAITYEKLAQAGLAIQRGAKFLATNGDRSFPTERGLEPGCGALLSVIESTTGVKPKLYGKPEPEMFEHGLRILGTPAELTGMVGDRYETDIVGAKRVGMTTIAVTTGVNRDDEFRAASPPPDHIFPSVVELRAALDF